MRKKRLPWWRPKMGPEEIKLLGKVLESDFPNEGKFADKFEGKIEKLTGAKHAVAVTSGTSGIFLALKAIGVGRGDEVIVPDLTFIATANAVELCGAKPVLVDIDPVTLNISLESAKKAVTERTKAVVPVHVSGRSVDVKGVIDFASEHQIQVVEDAAEGFMSRYMGKYLGTFGSCGVLSFSPNKIITTGQGGMVLTDDDEIHVRLRELKDQGRPVRGTGGDDVHSSVGYNFKFTDLQAAVGLGQLNYLKRRMKRLKQAGAIYRKELSGIDGIRILPADMKNGELPLWTDAIIEKRDFIESNLRRQGMDCRKFWHPLHTQDPYKLPDERFPVSSKLSPKAIWLPSAYTLTNDDIHTVCDSVRRLLG